jgi:hypothetical protein
VSATSTAHQNRPDPVQQLFQAAGGYIFSSCLWVVNELKIADALATGPKSAAQLAQGVGVKAEPLARVLRPLAMMEIFTETAPGVFALTPAADLLRSGVPESQQDSIRWICDPFHFQVNAELLHSLRTGQPAVEKVTGKSAFDTFAENSVENERFNAAMTCMSKGQVPVILDAYDFSPYHTIVDVGGGHGYLLSEILQKYPQAEGILFDLDRVLAGAQDRISGFKSRCRTVAGDFFQGVPEGGDLYVMKMIIHDWDDEKAGTILNNCRKALGQKASGKLLLFEMVLPSANEPHMAKLLDVEMLLFPGGHERTPEQYRQLFSRSGLQLTRIIPTKSPMSIVEAQVAAAR